MLYLLTIALAASVGWNLYQRSVVKSQERLLTFYSDSNETKRVQLGEKNIDLIRRKNEIIELEQRLLRVKQLSDLSVPMEPL